MMSKQKLTYEEMISKLQCQTYEAPNDWSKIEMDLDLNLKVSQIKSYAAPDDLWGMIDTQLTSEQSILQQPKPNKAGSNWKYLSLAFILISIITTIYYYSAKKDTDVSYSSEVIVASTSSETLDLRNQDEDHSVAFDFIKEHEFLYTAKDKIEFEKQLEELQETKKEIFMMQEQYGVDKNTQKMLAKVERQIAELLKSMITAA